MYKLLCFSEEKELILTTTINEIIKLRWVALGPRNYGKSIEWKLEGDPWDTEGIVFCIEKLYNCENSVFLYLIFR